ncbi:MAG: ComF family protein [Cocleimonas sp.]
MGLFLKSSCVLCNSAVSRSISLCQSCEDDLPLLEHACKQCGLPLNSADVIDSVCGQCLKNPTAVDYTVCLYHYQVPLNHLITELKYKQKLVYAEVLGQLLSKRVEGRVEGNAVDIPDCILPVPLYRGRLVKRGFNQSLEIAQPVSKRLKVPIEETLARRIKKTRSQTDLDAIQRSKNMRGCFEISPKVSKSYDHVVIIDDVVTTGSTVNELAIVLKESGVKKVGVWSIARATIK